MTEQEALDFIDNEIKNNDVVLFMKGSADFPQCGFSAAVASILQSQGVEFKDINVLTSDAVRQGIKKYSDWPTIPQLYIKGEFIGGCDIVRELYESGELTEIIKKQLHNSQSRSTMSDTDHQIQGL